MTTKTLPTVQELYTRDYHTCDCAWPHVERAWGGAVGVFREIRLCCMARALEKLLELPEGTFYWTADFEPQFEWDCLEPQWDGDGRFTGLLGPPPEWMTKRMKAKGIPIRHLPAQGGADGSSD